jgi:hypothetical protein
MLTGLQELLIVNELEPLLQQTINSIVAETRAARYQRRAASFEELNHRVSVIEHENSVELSSAVRAGCLNRDGSRKPGKTFDAELAREQNRRSGSAHYQRARGLTPSQRARMECEERRARGERIDAEASAAIFRKYCSQ